MMSPQKVRVVFPDETAMSPGFPKRVGPPVSVFNRLGLWLWFRLKLGAQLALLAGGCYLSYLFISYNFVQTVEVDGDSMVPTLQNAQRLVLNHWIVKFRAPRPSDIVVLRDPQDNGYAVKRIVAKEGDAVYLKRGHVYLNGSLLEEPYLPPGTATYGFSNRHGEQLTICGKSTYFVLGDNRSNSTDSRMYGPVPRENILGTIIQ